MQRNTQIKRPEERSREFYACDGDGLAGIHLGGELGVRIDCRCGGDIAPLAQILREHALDEVLNVEVLWKSHVPSLASAAARDKLSARTWWSSPSPTGHSAICTA